MLLEPYAVVLLIMGSYFKSRGDVQPQTLRDGPVDELRGQYALHPTKGPTMQLWPEGLREKKEGERFLPRDIRIAVPRIPYTLLVFKA